MIGSLVLRKTPKTGGPLCWFLSAFSSSTSPAWLDLFRHSSRSPCKTQALPPPAWYQHKGGSDVITIRKIRLKPYPKNIIVLYWSFIVFLKKITLILLKKNCSFFFEKPYPNLFLITSSRKWSLWKWTGIKKMELERDLGVIVGDDLMWTGHVDRIVGKADMMRIFINKWCLVYA